MTKLRVLMTGHRGYVGSVMAPVLSEAGHQVTGIDVDYYRGCDLTEPPRIPSIGKDIRDVQVHDLEGFDAIIHLAALSNDPVGNLNSEWTRSINEEATAALAARAREAGVKRFLFASSAIMYGLSEEADVNEESPLNPQTDYARSKVAAERALATFADESFSPVLLRNGTIYGLSPRMRFDTVLNSLVGAAVTTGKITVLGNGEPWRPVVHLRDVSRAFLAVLEAPRPLVHNRAFNVGADMLNIRVRDLADAVRHAVPDAQVEILSRADADRRTYRTSFARFSGAFPEFSFEFSPRAGAAELAYALRSIGLTHEQYDSDRFTRLRRIDRLIREGRVDPALRWVESEVGV